MKIQYLGTAASEGWPALFCTCENCERARKFGGKNIRTRSQSIIDDRLLIDFPADAYFHALNYHIDLSSIEHLLITHSHEDHFYPLDIILKSEPYAYGGTKKIHVYGNDVVTRMMQKVIHDSNIDENCVVPVYINPFEPFSAGEYTVTALIADHMDNKETCYNYIIEKNGKRLLYAHDTGVFPAASWDYLSKLHFDFVSLDCNYVILSSERGHMGLPNDAAIRSKMLNCGCADGKTKFAINHFSHNGKAIYDELKPIAAKQGFLTAYDGMIVEF